MRADHIYQEPPCLERGARPSHPPQRYPGSGCQEMHDTPLPPRHTVLVVHPQADVLRNLQHLLSVQYRVVGTTEPQVALDIMKEQPVHIVLADQRLPAMTGVELLRHLSAFYAETVRLIVTGHADMKPVLEAVNRGQIYRYITKPWDPEDVLAILRQAAAHHDLRRHCNKLRRELRDANEKLQTANAERVRTYDTTLAGWLRALELRHHETNGHSHRASEMTVRLAAAMGMEGDQLLQVRRGALLHDIGKVGIPDSILVKPGPLTEDEWGIMKRHASYAYELLGPIGYLQEALDIPYCHHERWDGTGYPRGLKGEEIPLAARIFAVIDVWDALCSDRPYRKAWPEPRAREYITALAGTHFDPAVVDTFLRMVA